MAKSGDRVPHHTPLSFGRDYYIFQIILKSYGQCLTIRRSIEVPEKCHGFADCEPISGQVTARPCPQSEIFTVSRLRNQSTTEHRRLTISTTETLAILGSARKVAQVAPGGTRSPHKSSISSSIRRKYIGQNVTPTRSEWSPGQFYQGLNDTTPAPTIVPPPSAT